MTEENKELTARLLCRFCAWRWMRDKLRDRWKLSPPFPASFGVGVWMAYPQFETRELEAERYDVLPDGDAAPDVAKRFSDWDRVCGVEALKYQMESGMPRLTESLDACATLIKAIVAKGMRVKTDVFIFNGSWIEARILDNADELISVWSGDVPEYSVQAMALAICRAADAIPVGVAT